MMGQVWPRLRPRLLGALLATAALGSVLGSVLGTVVSRAQGTCVVCVLGCAGHRDRVWVVLEVHLAFASSDRAWWWFGFCMLWWWRGRCLMVAGTLWWWQIKRRELRSMQ